MLLSTHRVAFRHAAVHPDRPAVVKQGGVWRHLPAAYGASCRQKVVGNAFCVQPGFKRMPLQGMNF